MRQIRSTKKPENIFRDSLMAYLKARDWMVKTTHGNLYQSGFPDLYLAHLRMGSRWVECKIDEHCQFTNAQLEEFPLFSAKGVGIWVLSVSKEAVANINTDRANWERLLEAQYKKLFQPSNWHMYLQIMKHHSRLNI